MSNINWSALTASQIREVVRTWPDVPEYARFKTPGAPVKITTPAVKPQAAQPTKPAKKSKAKPAAAAPSKRQKHVGADGAVKFVEHRKIWIGFFGGRAVVKRSTEKACREALKAQFGVEQQGE